MLISRIHGVQANAGESVGLVHLTHLWNSIEGKCSFSGVLQSVKGGPIEVNVGIVSLFQRCSGLNTVIADVTQAIVDSVTRVDFVD